MKRLAAAVVVLLTACAGTPEAGTQLISTTESTVAEISVAQKKTAFEAIHERMEAEKLFLATIAWQEQVRKNEEEAARKAQEAKEAQEALDAARRSTYQTATVRETVEADPNKAWLSDGFMYRLAGCETGGKYDNPAGDPYDGYFQMTDWAWKNGDGEAGRKPHEFPYEHQRTIARHNIETTSFSGQHPHCSKTMRAEGYEVRS